MTEIRNPAKLPTDLNLVEEKFVRCLVKGQPCIVGNGDFSTSRPKERIESGDDANMVRSEVIRFFAYGGNEENPVLGPAIDLHGAWIVGVLDLTHASIPYALLFGNCHFDACVRMQHAECAALYLNGSRLAQGLRADGLTTKGDVNLQSGFSVEGEVRLPGANIGGDLSCDGGKFHNPRGYALIANGLVAKGTVYLSENFSAEGEVRLLDANIGGSLNCVNGKFHNLSRKALNADGLTTKGSVNLRGQFSAEGEVRLLNANIGRNLDCENGKFHNPGGMALSADGLMTKGSVHLRRGFSAEGEVRLPGANIGGNLDCADGKFYNPGKYALSVDGLTTIGSVNLGSGFFAEGEVVLLHANIGRNLDCTGGKFNNLDGKALVADGLIAKGGVNLSNGFSAEGEVRLLHASIGINLDCTDGKFRNAGRDALSADSLTTTGSVMLRLGFSAEGGVRMLNANIGRHLDCMGGKFHNPQGYALNVDGGNISGGLFWWKTTCVGNVHLAYANVNVLADDSDSWESCKVNLNGFIYSQFSNPMDAQSRIDWLAKRPDGMKFSPLPYEQVAKVLRAAGKDIDAWDIEREKRRLERAERDFSNSFKIPGWRRLWGWAIDELTDFVYRPWKTVGWAIIIVCASAFLFNVAAHHNQIIPHQPAVLASAEYQAARKENPPMEAARIAFPVEYPEFAMLTFALDVFIPFFVLHQESFWAPASNMEDDWWKSSILLVLLLAELAVFAWLARCFQNWIRRKQGGVPAPTWAGFGMAFFVSLLGFNFAAGSAFVFLDFEIGLWLVDWRWLTVWYWLEIIAGWILTSLFLLSVPSVLRLRQSSGERD